MTAIGRSAIGTRSGMSAAQLAAKLGPLQSEIDAAEADAAQAKTMATTASSTATSASGTATAAQTAVASKATRIDLGTVTVTYQAVIALGAGARSLEVDCAGAQVGDAVFVAATNTVPDGYAVGAAQCLTAGKIRVSVIHPALGLLASFSIALRVFVLR